MRPLLRIRWLTLKLAYKRWRLGDTTIARSLVRTAIGPRWKWNIGIVVLVVIAFMVGGLRAQGHTVAELEAWTEAWTAQADIALSPALTADLADMEARHPWYYNPQTAPVGSQTATGHTSAVDWDTSAGVEQWRALVTVYFPAGEVERALCIMDHESRGNPNAKNPRSSAAGLFQFLRSTWNNVPLSVSGGSYDSGQVYQAEPNIASAAWLQERSGWWPWNPYQNGECR